MCFQQAGRSGWPHRQEKIFRHPHHVTPLGDMVTPPIPDPRLKSRRREPRTNRERVDCCCRMDARETKKDRRIFIGPILLCSRQRVGRRLSVGRDTLIGYCRRLYWLSVPSAHRLIV